MPTKPCTNGGNYNVTELSLKGQTELCNKNGFNQVSIRCRDDVMIQFLRECSNEVKDSGILRIILLLEEECYHFNFTVFHVCM